MGCFEVDLEDVVQTSNQEIHLFDKLNTYCPYFENVGKPGGGVNFWAKYLENTLQDETMAENGDKIGLITKEIWLFEVERLKLNSRK